MSHRDGGGVAVSTAMKSRKNAGTYGAMALIDRSTSDRLYWPYPVEGGELRSVEVCSDIRMGDLNVPHPRDFVRIQY